MIDRYINMIDDALAVVVVVVLWCVVVISHSFGSYTITVTFREYEHNLILYSGKCTIRCRFFAI